MNPRSSGKRTVASLQDLWNRACEAASSSFWKVPSADGVATSTMTRCVFSPEPAILVSNKYDTTALRFTNSSNTDRKSTRLNSSHSQISYAVFCLKKKKTQNNAQDITGAHTDAPHT